MKSLVKLLSVIAVVACAAPATHGNDRWGLDQIGPEFKSAGVMDFGPDGILLVGDAKQAAVIALQTPADVSKAGNLDVANIDSKIAQAANVSQDAVQINDLAVHPQNGHAFLSVHIVKDGQAEASIWHCDGNSVRPLAMEKTAYARLDMPSPPEDKVTGNGRRQRNLRDQSITGLTYTDGRILVSGLAKSDSPSSVWEFQFPFGEENYATNVEIYHAAHGRYEDNAAIRSFVSMNIDGKPTLLAGYTCTPLVRLPLDALEKNEGKVRGTTIAELGNWNQPLDMLVYEKEGTPYVLMANSARGMMKITMDGVQSNPGLTERVPGGGTAGQKFEQIEALNGVVKMARLGASQIVVLEKAGEAGLNLRTVDLP